MYTASGGYYYSGSSLNQKRPKRNILGRIPLFQLSMFITLFILVFVFGAVMHAYATIDKTFSYHTRSNP